MRASEIEETLKASIDIQSIMVIDESHLHRGHAGARPYGQSHYKVVIVSNEFDGKSRVARQRTVFQVLGSAVGNEIHALSLNLLTPVEAA